MNVLSTTTIALLALAAPAVMAETVEFDFEGLGGPGLTSANEVGDNTPATLDLPTSAFGGEIGEGFVLDTESNVLDFAFEFSELSGGLFDAVSGIHLHLIAEGADIFTTTGPIIFNLNSGTDPTVTNTNELIPAGSGDGSGATDGVVTGSLVLSEVQEQAFLDGRYYLNIHSDTFQGGELRGNLVQANPVTAIPSPAAAGLGLGLLSLLATRRRQARA